MKKIIVIIFIILSIGSVYYLFKKNNVPKPPAITEIPSMVNSPYAVENLSSKVNQNTVITVEKELEKQPKFTSYLISFTSENLKEYALMNVPSGQKPKSGWPIVIVNHGYINPKNYSTQNSYKNTSTYYANQGFLVLKPDYRGHDQSEGSPSLFFSRSEYAVDVLNLISGIKTLKDADSGKIFMYGHSMGGEVSLLVAENTNNIKGVSLWAPATADFPESVTFFLSRRDPAPSNLPQLKTEIQKIIESIGADKFSSLTYLSKINTPIIVHHSTTDESVPYSWGENLVDKLKSADKKVSFYSYPDDNHDIARNWSLALSRDIEFFKGF